MQVWEDGECLGTWRMEPVCLIRSGAANLELDSLREPGHTCLGNELSTNNYLVILVRLQNQVLFCIVLFFFSSFQRLELNPGLEHTRQSLYHWVIIPVQVTVPLNLTFFIYKRIPILCQHYYECSIRFYVVINYTIYKYYSQYKTSPPKIKELLNWAFILGWLVA